MQIALDAIRSSQAGDRDELRSNIRDSLFDTVRDSQHSVLGDYSIDRNGDTTQTSYGVSKGRRGALTPPQRAP
ncbi:MAG: hypothetical protein QOJ63_1300 [Solirubrobacteraceae bacterium]|jgi:hypothetical protein|nr:hypothetical protein [Solirubrobacteraceae bacterium]